MQLFSDPQLCPSRRQRTLRFLLWNHRLSCRLGVLFRAQEPECQLISGAVFSPSTRSCRPAASHIRRHVGRLRERRCSPQHAPSQAVSRPIGQDRGVRDNEIEGLEQQGDRGPLVHRILGLSWNARVVDELCAPDVLLKLDVHLHLRRVVRVRSRHTTNESVSSSRSRATIARNHRPFHETRSQISSGASFSAGQLALRSIVLTVIGPDKLSVCRSSRSGRPDRRHLRCGPWCPRPSRA